jgi:D-alanine-D-alanine ligase
MTLRISLLAGGACTAHDASLLMLKAMADDIAADNSRSVQVEHIYYIERGGSLRHIAVGAGADLARTVTPEHLAQAEPMSVSAFVDSVTSTRHYVFSLLQGTDGEDGVYQGFFKVLGVLSNLGSVYPAAISRHKWAQSLVAEHLVAGLNPIRTARFSTKSSLAQLTRIASEFSGIECIVKPNDLGGSVHTCVLDQVTVPALQEYLRQAQGYAQEYLVQERVIGEEYTVGCVRINGQTVVLPVAQVLTPKAFLGFTEKWTEPGYRIHFIADDDPRTRLLGEISQVLFDDVGFDTACRFDFIVSVQGVYFLEANSKPGLASDSFLTCMLRQQGMSLADFVVLCYEDASRQWRRKVDIDYATEVAREAQTCPASAQA